MKVDVPLVSFLESVEARFVVCPLSNEAAKLGADLSDFSSGDPCDRFIAGTAIAQNLPLVTSDFRIRESNAVKTIW